MMFSLMYASFALVRRVRNEEADILAKPGILNLKWWLDSTQCIYEDIFILYFASQRKCKPTLFEKRKEKKMQAHKSVRLHVIDACFSYGFPCHCYKC